MIWGLKKSCEMEVDNVSGRFKIVKSGQRYYIKKRFLYFWYKTMPDHGLGWGINSYKFIFGVRSESIAKRIIKEYYE